MDSAIHFRSAVAMVGRFPVLAGIDLDVATGETVLLRGPNGAGKTSLLRACAGLLRVATGEAVVLGQDLVCNPRAVRRRVGLLGHSTALYEDLSPLDNIRFFLRASRRPSGNAETALEGMGLTGRLRTTPVAALSAGQKRRAAIAVIVASDPELWLLDEPHAGLDAGHRDRLDAVIRAAAARGSTVIVSSHEEGRAESLADRAVFMAGGVIRDDGGHGFGDTTVESSPSSEGSERGGSADLGSPIDPVDTLDMRGATGMRGAAHVA